MTSSLTICCSSCAGVRAAWPIQYWRGPPGDCWARHGFFGVSVFGAPEDDLVALSRAVRAIGRRRMLRVTRCGELRAAGLEVMPTFANPAHYSVVLPDVSTRTFGALRACFSTTQPNPGYEPDR
jgi:hypothetical protein